MNFRATFLKKTSREPVRESSGPGLRPKVSVLNKEASIKTRTAPIAEPIAEVSTSLGVDNFSARMDIVEKSLSKSSGQEINSNDDVSLSEEQINRLVDIIVSAANQHGIAVRVLDRLTNEKLISHEAPFKKVNDKLDKSIEEEMADLVAELSRIKAEWDEDKRQSKILVSDLNAKIIAGEKAISELNAKLGSEEIEGFSMKSIPYPKKINRSLFDPMRHLIDKKVQAKHNVEMWGDNTVRIFRTGEVVTDPDIIAFEHKCAAEAVAEDNAGGSAPERRVCRAFSIGFLVAMTFELNLWSWKTFEVVEFLVKPLTESLRCRFADLPEFAEYTGHADIIMSHSWVPPKTQAFLRSHCNFRFINNSHD